MVCPITRYQLIASIETYGFRPEDAERIVRSLEQSGRIDTNGSMIYIRNPTDPDALLLLGLCEAARGGTPRNAPRTKVVEYLRYVREHASAHGSTQV